MVTKRDTSVFERIEELDEQRRRAIVDMDVLNGDLLPVDMQQAETIDESRYILKDYHRDTPRVFIGRETPLRFDPTDRRRAVVPDIAFAEDVDPEPILAYPSTSYTIWEVGKPPDLVVEIASPTTYEKDLYEKPDIYESIGIYEYWLFDHTGGIFYGQGLMGYRLVDGSYEKIELFVNEDGIESGYSEVLGLNLCAADRDQREALLSRQPNLLFQECYNPVQLMFQDPETGLYLLNAEGRRESERQAEEARQRSERRVGEVEDARRRSENRVNEAESSLAAERDSHEETRAELEDARSELDERDARIRELEDLLRGGDS